MFVPLPDQMPDPPERKSFPRWAVAIMLILFAVTLPTYRAIRVWQAIHEASATSPATTGMLGEVHLCPNADARRGQFSQDGKAFNYATTDELQAVRDCFTAAWRADGLAPNAENSFTQFAGQGPIETQVVIGEWQTIHGRIYTYSCSRAKVATQTQCNIRIREAR